MAQGEALVVVDASVAVKWFTREEFSDSAARLLAMHREGKVSLASPYLLTYEVANALRYNPGFGIQDVKRAVRALEGLQVSLFPPAGELMDISAEVAFTHGLSFYDSTYVALAMATKSTFYTADREVVKKVQKDWVKHIGALGERENTPRSNPA